MLAIACAAALLAPAQEPAAPTDATLDAWLAHLAPAPDELAWERIPWLPTFADGMRAAAAQDKPLLLWVMNGHPLGCT